MRFIDNPDMSFLEHLEELRNVLFRVGGCLLLLFPVAAYFSQDMIDLLVLYCCPPGFELKYFSPMEPLWVQLKIALLAAIVTGMPYIAWQIWRFIAPGLYERERLLIRRVAAISWLMFILGAVFCLSFILPLMMKFSLELQTKYVQPVIGLESFISMTGLLMLGFGVMFQFPILIYVLIHSGIVEITTVRKKRPYIIVLVLILAAVLTPPDIVSQIMLAVPSYLMFEISLLIASISCRRKNRCDETAGDNVAPSPIYSAEAVPVEDCGKDDFRPEMIYRSTFGVKRRKICNINTKRHRK